MTLHSRATAMEARLIDTATRLGTPAAELTRLRLAYAAAMAGARGALDPHHPDFLHTARTALILLDDLGLADGPTLAAALVTDTRDESLAPPPRLLATLGPETRAIAAAVPTRGPEPLLEALLAAPPAARLVALAERLDHARHLHLRGRGEWAGYHSETCAAYATVAARENDRLGRRFGWWCGMFQRRFLTV